LDVERAAAVFDSQTAPEHDRDLVKVGLLAGFDPAAGTAHVRDARLTGSRSGAAGVFVNQFRLIAGGGNSGGYGDECRHGEPGDGGIRYFPIREKEKLQCWLELGLA
jgi:hypothetical protein